MIVRRVVRVAAWGAIGLFLLMGVGDIWCQINDALNFAGMQYPLWDIARSLLVAVPQNLVPVFLGIGAGGVCLLIADVHERLERKA